LVETADAYPELTVRENLEVMRRLRPGTEPQAVDRVIGQLGLHAYADRRTNTLSHGNAQRLGLAKALLHNPELIILDEPANGLDPAGIVEIRNLLIELTTKQGVTVCRVTFWVKCRGWRNVLALFIKGDCCRNSMWMNLNAIGGDNLSFAHEIIRRRVQCL
jgi:ABC-type branched-subunit amino acid transport system ATPase component